MRFTEYQEQAAVTAIYPTHPQCWPDSTHMGSLLYPVMGLVGEVGECSSLLLTIISMNSEQGIDEMRAELGDVLWMASQIANELDADLGEMLRAYTASELADMAHVMDIDLMDELDTFDELEQTASALCDSQPIVLAQGATNVKATTALWPLTVMSMCSGQISGICAKTIRDDGGQITDEMRNNILDLCGATIYGICCVGARLRISMESIAEYNLKKLADRASRDVLNGSGDDR